MPKINRLNALVTGASGGIGQAVVMALLSNGYNVHAHVRKEMDKTMLANMAEEEKLQVHVCDLSDTEAVRHWIGNELQAVSIDLLINNAALAFRLPFGEVSVDQWEQLFKVNVTASFMLSQWAFRSMRAKGTGGLIVQMGSLASVPMQEKFPGFSAYTASKYACAGLAENIASEGMPYGIRSVCLSPGMVNTKMLREMHPGATEWMEPEEVAMFLVSLAKDYSHMLNGMNLPVYKTGAYQTESGGES
ncbi:SDR family oxidoreductase [Paenibacillus sp. SYP-B4298]|uniref:SDR family oxidoreductase n=1 Tax=Paenibacillus sp. SYP-B4298 TaxID=2996034 RepID=UPI0022DD30C8|nr:SDR family oxidoreductase [Paenibacillus sp. SYP-B4298]